MTVAVWFVVLICNDLSPLCSWLSLKSIGTSALDVLAVTFFLLETVVTLFSSSLALFATFHGHLDMSIGHGYGLDLVNWINLVYWF